MRSIKTIFTFLLLFMCTAVYCIAKLDSDPLSFVSFGPDAGINMSADGGDLLTNLAPVGSDYFVLNYVKQQRTNAAQHKYSYPRSRLILSGAIEAMASKDLNHSTKGQEQLTRADFNALFEVNSFINLYAATGIDANDHIKLTNGFVTLGNTMRSPFYLSAGQYYVPFGNYATSVIDSVQPIEVALGAVHANTITVGYHPSQQNAFVANVYAFEQNVKVLHDNTPGYGINLGLNHSFGKLTSTYGVSVINNMANSDGMKELYPTTAPLKHAVPGGDLRLSLGYDNYGFIAEYVSALSAFDASNMTYNGHSALPHGVHLELNHSFKLFKKLNTLAVGLTRTSDSLALNVPQQRVYLLDALTLHRNLNLSFELNIDTNYSSSTTASYQNTPVVQDGQTHVGGFAQLSYYF